MRGGRPRLQSPRVVLERPSTTPLPLLLHRRAQELLDARPRLATDVQERFDRDGAIGALVATPPAEHAAATDRLLAANTGPRGAISESLAAQERLLERVRTLHVRFGEVR